MDAQKTRKVFLSSVTFRSPAKLVSNSAAKEILNEAMATYDRAKSVKS